MKNFIWHIKMLFLRLIQVKFLLIQENRSRIIAGDFNADGSYRDGDSASSRFNNIKSVIYFSKNETEAQKEYTKTTIIL